jgi:hypothetical protein
VSGLSALRELSEPRLHILLSYRADLEGRLGTLWQRISGSPRGLARIYIGGLDSTGFLDQLKRVCDELQISIGMSNDELARVLNDLRVASKNWTPTGLYPPYVQMLIDFMFSARGQGEPFRFQTYENSGRIFGIVRDYLSKQLRLAHDDTGDLRLLLVALVKSYGVKAQRSIQELATDTGLEIGRSEALLERLIDLRLARHISGLYEVSHDFLAKIITEELVDSEEREFKRFRELLTSRATAFTSTLSRLTLEEVLFLYKHKRRIIFNEAETALMIDTWVKDENVPGLFWIKDFDRGIVQTRLALYETSDLDPEHRFRIARLKRLFGIPLSDRDFIALTKIWKGAQEAANLLSAIGDQIRTTIALLGLRSRQGAIRSACGQILTRKLRAQEWNVIEALRGSQRKSYFRLFFELVVDPSIPLVTDKRTRALTEFSHLQLIMRAPPGQEDTTLTALKSLRPRRVSVSFGATLLAIRKGKLARAIKPVASSNRKRAQSIILATEAIQTNAEFKVLLELYLTLNQAEIDTQKTPAIAEKAEGLARTIRHLTSAKRLDALRRMFVGIELKPSARDIVLALLTNGDVDDVTAVLSKIGRFPHQMHYENHMELCLAAKEALLKSSKGIPAEYKSWVKSREFWTYLTKGERNAAEGGAVLPLQNQSNRVLFIRLLAHAIVGLARSIEDESLNVLLRHSFRTISGAAAIRMTEIIGERALDFISTDIDESVARGRANILGSAIRVAEEGLYISSIDTFHPSERSPDGAKSNLGARPTC